MYSKLEGLMIQEGVITNDQQRVFVRIWKSLAPSKVAAFSWKLLHNRIPTRDNLDFRHALPPDSPLGCVMCDGEWESATHLFLHCEVAMKVWDSVMRWLAMNFLIPPNLFLLWENWDGASYNKKIRSGYRLVWHAVVWSLQ